MFSSARHGASDTFILSLHKSSPAAGSRLLRVFPGGRVVSAQAEHFNSKPQIPALLHAHSRRRRNKPSGVGLADGRYLEPLLEAEMSTGTRGVDLKDMIKSVHSGREGKCCYTVECVLL